MVFAFLHRLEAWIIIDTKITELLDRWLGLDSLLFFKIKLDLCLIFKCTFTVKG
jgi:hypothetical protein